MKKKLRDVTLLIINQSAPGMGQHKKNLRNDEKNTKASLRFFFTTVIKPYFFLIKTSLTTTTYLLILKFFFNIMYYASFKYLGPSPTVSFCSVSLLTRVCPICNALRKRCVNALLTRYSIATVLTQTRNRVGHVSLY